VAKAPTLFTFLDQISTKSTVHKYDKSIASAYMLSLWLSHDLQLLPIVQKMNFVQFELPDEVVYDYYFYQVPKKKKRYIRWTKKTPEDKKKIKEVNAIAEKYNVSRRRAKDILSYKEKIK